MTDNTRALGASEMALYFATTADLRDHLPPGSRLEDPAHVAALLRAEVRRAGALLIALAFAMQGELMVEDAIFIVAMIGRRLDLMADVGVEPAHAEA